MKTIVEYSAASSVINDGKLNENLSAAHYYFIDVLHSFVIFLMKGVFFLTLISIIVILCFIVFTLISTIFYYKRRSEHALAGRRKVEAEKKRLLGHYEHLCERQRIAGIKDLVKRKTVQSKKKRTTHVSGRAQH